MVIARPRVENGGRAAVTLDLGLELRADHVILLRRSALRRTRATAVTPRGREVPVRGDGAAAAMAAVLARRSGEHRGEKRETRRGGCGGVAVEGDPGAVKLSHLGAVKLIHLVFVDPSLLVNLS